MMKKRGHGKKIDKKEKEEIIKSIDNSKHIKFEGNKKLSKKPEKIILVSILIVALLGGVAFYYSYKQNAEVTPITEETPLEKTPEETRETINQEPAGPTPSISIGEEPKQEEKPQEIQKPSEKPEAEVKVTRAGFEPKYLNITKGTTVVWRDTESYTHFIKFNVREGKTEYSQFTTPVFGGDKTFSHLFNETLVWEYADIYWGNRGYINVK